MIIVTHFIIGLAIWSGSGLVALVLALAFDR